MKSKCPVVRASRLASSSSSSSSSLSASAPWRYRQRRFLSTPTSVRWSKLVVRAPTPPALTCCPRPLSLAAAPIGYTAGPTIVNRHANRHAIASRRVTTNQHCAYSTSQLSQNQNQTHINTHTPETSSTHPLSALRELSSPPSPLLEQIKALFPDAAGLHARIDSLLRINSGETAGPRIAFLPMPAGNCSRQDIKSVLDAMLIDPLASEQSSAWYDAFSSRTLSKDILVRYAPSFEYIGTFNSMAEYPVPFRGGENQLANYQFIEANSIGDSWDNIKSCHLLVFVTRMYNSASASAHTDVQTDFPYIVAVDKSATEPEPMPPSSGVVEINSKRALDAMMELKETRAHAGANVAQYDRNMGQLLSRTCTVNPQALYSGLVESVVKSCQNLMPDPGLALRVEQGVQDMKKIRTSWSEHAHTELQIVLVPGLDHMDRHDLAWWKLYFRVDDVYDTVCATLYESFLPKSKSSLLYYMGRIDIQAKTDYGFEPSSASSGKSGESAITIARDSLIENGTVVDLHNMALKILTTNLFMVQMPFIFIPLLGAYFYGYSLYAMGSLVGLGLVAGFARIQKQWTSAVESFKSKVVQDARAAIAQSEDDLWTRYEHRVIGQQNIVKKKQQLVDSLKLYIR